MKKEVPASTSFRVKAALLALWMLCTASAAGAEPHVAVLRLEGAIQPASLRYVERGLTTAADDGASLVVLELDTPGGTLVSLRAMATAVTQSKVPVAVYVTPAGAHAASAGFFILLAADVAAMAPGTNTGAAHPVALGGEPNEQPNAQQPANAKALEDAAAFARSLAASRGRSVEWAEKAVRDARSYSAGEARELGLIDEVASDRAALLSRLDGRELRGEVLELTGARIVTLAPTFAERVLMVIGDPQVAFLLLMLGFLGLMVELFSPGAIFPGVAGGLSLLLALYAFSVLPVNWVGVLLLAAGVGLLVAEGVAPTAGFLGIGGVASLTLGALMLFDSPLPAVRVPWTAIVPTVLLLAAVTLGLASRAMRVRRQRAITGLEAMVGETGELIGGIEQSQGEGKIFVHGEYWAATADRPLPGGARVRVERVEGSRLRVAPLSLADA